MKPREFWPAIAPVQPRGRVNYRFSSTMTREQFDELQRLSEDEGTPMTQLVRVAIDDFLSRKRRERAA